MSKEKKFLAESLVDSCFGGRYSTFSPTETYEEALEAAQKAAHVSGEETLVYQAIASADPDVKKNVKVTKLT